MKPETQARLELLGRERALIYKTLILTGLRKGELDSLTVGQLELDRPKPHLVLDAADDKSGRGASIPLREDLVRDLREWLASKLEVARCAARLGGLEILERQPASTPLFNVPTQFVRILDRDLALAGITKRDERGRTVDVHALRHSFGTHLSKGGVPLRTAQAAMRHSDPRLTANVYTDPKLLDIAGAVDALPSLPLPSGSHTDAAQQRATGTDGRGDELAPMLAPNSDKSGASRSTVDKGRPDGTARSNSLAAFTTDGIDRSKDMLTEPVKTRQRLGVIGFEPTASCSQSRRSSQAELHPVLIANC